MNRAFAGRSPASGFIAAGSGGFSLQGKWGMREIRTISL